MQTAGSHKGGPDDDATEKTTMWTKQRKEDEASQAPKDVVSHDDGGQCQPGD
jgi:hypothetical protein